MNNDGNTVSKKVSLTREHMFSTITELDLTMELDSEQLPEPDESRGTEWSAGQITGSEMLVHQVPCNSNTEASSSPDSQSNLQTYYTAVSSQSNTLSLYITPSRGLCWVSLTAFSCTIEICLSPGSYPDSVHAIQSSNFPRIPLIAGSEAWSPANREMTNFSLKSWQCFVHCTHDKNT